MGNTNNISGTEIAGTVTAGLGSLGTAYSTYADVKGPGEKIAQIQSMRMAPKLGDDSYSSIISDYENQVQIPTYSPSDFNYSLGKGITNAVLAGGQGAAAGASFGGIGAAIGGIAGLGSGIASLFAAEHKARKSANEANRIGQNVMAYNQRSLTNRLNAADAESNFNLERNYNTTVTNAANGGPINTNGNGVMSPFGKRFDTGGLAAHGVNWTNGLITINNGSTHENNPNDGVQIGVDPQGTPNLVEEGEVVFNDYVFSNRLKVPKAVRKKYKLRDKKGLTFAEAAKEISKESKERPNDPISKRGLEDWMTKLTNAQEEVRQAEAQKELIKQANALGVSPEELLAMQAQQAQGEQPVEQPTEMYPEMQGMPQGTIPMMGAYGGWKHGLGGNLFSHGGSPQYQLPGYDDFSKSFDNYWESLIGEGGTTIPNYGKIYKTVVGDWDTNSEDVINGMANPSNYAYNSLRKYWEKQPSGTRPWEQKTISAEDKVGTLTFDRFWDDVFTNKSDDEANKLYATLTNTTSPTKYSIADIKTDLSSRWDKEDPIFNNYRYFGEPFSEVSPSIKDLKLDSPKLDLTLTPEIKYPRLLNQEVDNLASNFSRSLREALFEGAKGTIADQRTPTQKFLDRAMENGSFGELPIKPSRGMYLFSGEKEKTDIDDTLGTDWLTNLRYVPALGSALSVFSDLMGWSNKPDYSNADMIMNSARSIGNVRYNPIGDYMRYTPLDRLFYINQANANAAATRRALANTSGGNRGTAMAGILANDYNYINSLGQLARQAEEYNLAQREKVASFNRTTNMANAENDLKAQIANRENERLRIGATESAAQMRDAIDARISAAKSANLTNLFDNIGNIGWEEFNRNMVNTSNVYYNIDRNGRLFWTEKGLNELSDQQRQNLLNDAIKYGGVIGVGNGNPLLYSYSGVSRTRRGGR